MSILKKIDKENMNKEANENKVIKKINLNLILRYLISFIIIIPIIYFFMWMITKSLPFPNILPKQISIDGFLYFFSPSTNSLSIIIYSIVLSLCVSVICIGLSIPSAKAIACYDFKGKELFKIIILSPIILPTLSIAMGVHIFFIKLKIANTFLGVLLIQIIPCIPYSFKLFLDVYEIIKDKMDIQARVLGASKLYILRKVTIPILADSIISAASMVFIVSFGQYFITFLIGGGRIYTYSIVMFPFLQNANRNVSAVYSLFFTIICLIVLFFIDKSLKLKYKKRFL